MPLNSRPESLRVLSLDGGGIKGYTSLLILQRIFRTMKSEGQLHEIPKPCTVFDLIVGTSTGGLIAVMLGRLHMSIEDCITVYERVGGEVFGKKPTGGKFGKMFKGMTSSTFYDIEILQEEIRKVLDDKKIPRDTSFRETGDISCKVMVCVTRTETSKPDVLRNYESLDPTAENYNCTIWEAASATAAAPMYFKGVKFGEKGEKWCDGGLRRNNPINEALSELTRERDWKDLEVGCILSLGTGVAKIAAVSSNLAGILKGALAIMTDSDDIARGFESSEFGRQLFRTHRYFRFSLPQGMQDLQLDDWKETEKMSALTADYLGRVSNGDMLLRCAKSLLDPDENLHIEYKPKQSLIPFHPCTHFIERRIYTEKLHEFFRSKTQYAQIYVLWGLGGIGKTQIALKFAQSVRQRFSVFWIRGDLFTNFVADYAQILAELDPASVGTINPKDDIAVQLNKTRRKLEEHSDEWLLIIDNADDADEFYGGTELPGGSDGLFMGKFLPRHGRMLITRRDRRFQGSVAAADNGVKVEEMTEKEALNLLIGSVPGYLVEERSDAANHAKQLIEELGYLPLAIAQAAANILEQQLSLSEYVSLYQEKKQRADLMQTPARDFQTTDPRNSIQSVRITWQISFDVLKRRHPLSAILITYIGCFHWRDIPRTLLRRLPEFRDLSEAEFREHAGKPLNLSLMDKQGSEPDAIEYQVHPLVHENILNQLTPVEMVPFLDSLIVIFNSVFPFVQDRQSPDWPLVVYLSAHVSRTLALCEEIQHSSESLSLLMLCMSQFLGISNVFADAVNLAERAKDMAFKVWSSSPRTILAFIQNLTCQYGNASLDTKQELEAREALEWLDSDFVKSSMDSRAIELGKIALQTDLSLSLLKRGHNAQREALHRNQLATGLVDEWSAKGIVIRHNLAHSLFHQHKLQEAMALNRSLLDFAETDAGKKEVDPRLYMIMLNLKCMIIRSTATYGDQNQQLDIQNSTDTHAIDEQHKIHTLVMMTSIEHLGLEDIDTWKAINNLIGFLSSTYRWIDCGTVLREVLPVGIKAKVKVDGKFAITLSDLTKKALNYLSHLESTSSSNSADVEEFSKLTEDWIAACGYTATATTTIDSITTGINNKGAQLQREGLFEEAEKLHSQSIELNLEGGLEVPGVYRYNLMLSIARQGRLEEAYNYRTFYSAQLEGPEETFGTLEVRLRRDETDRVAYHEAQQLLDTGQSMESVWTKDNEQILWRAEIRYGKLKIPEVSVAKEIQRKPGNAKRLLLPNFGRKIWFKTTRNA